MASVDLTDFSTVQEMIGCADGDSTIIKQIITSASYWANNYTSRTLKGDSLIEYYDGDNSTILFTKNYPIISITNLYQDSDRAFGTDTIIDTDDYVYDKVRGKITGINTSFWEEVQTIKLDYIAGYATVPNDLENAIIILVDWLYKSYDDHKWGVTAVGVADQRISYELGIPKQVKEQLTPYIKKVIL